MGTSVAPAPALILPFLNNAGVPNVGGSLLTQVGGVNYPTWQDAAGNMPLPNPIPLNSRGEISNSSGVSVPLYLAPSVVYEFTLYDANGNQIWIDPNVVAQGAATVGQMNDEKGLGGQSGFVAGVDFTAGTTTQLTLAGFYGNAANLWVAFDGAEQGADSFTLSGYVLTFNAPIPVGVNKVYVKGGTTLTIGTPGAGTVTDASVAPGSALYNRINDVIDVKDPKFGATGNGTTDDTAAIQAAINYAQSLAITDFWSTYVPAVRIPKGNYLVKGLQISYPIHLYGDGQNATVLNLANGANASVISVADMGALTGSDAGNIMPIISDMSIGCNSSGQTGGFSRGISIVDSSVPITTAYHGGAELRNLNIRAAFQYSVYIGVNRNNGRMNNVRSLYSTDEAVFSNAYDWRIDGCDFGNSSSSNGFTQNAGGALEMVNCNLFDNAESGLFINTGVNASCLFTNCYFDTNQLHGVAMNGSYGDIVSNSFSNCVWRDNSQAATNTYNHINAQNQGQITIEGATFVVNNQVAQPAYLVNTSNVVRVVFNATYEQNDTPNVPYQTAITNNFLNLAFAGNEDCSLSQMGASTVGVNGLNGANLDFYDAASTATQRRWRHRASGSEYFFLATDDAGVSTSVIAQVTRTGITPNAIQTISVQPYADNVFPSGSASFRWSVIYAGTGTINTSDEDSKDQIEAIPDAWLDAWATVDYMRYKFKDAIAGKGDGARWHIGLIAQRVRDAFATKGIDAHAIGLLCYDEWEATTPVIDEKTGKEVRPATPAGNRYGLRYEEAMCLEAALMRRELKRIQSR